MEDQQSGTISVSLSDQNVDKNSTGLITPVDQDSISPLSNLGCSPDYPP